MREIATRALAASNDDVGLAAKALGLTKAAFQKRLKD
jgi:hypothetical protein